MTDARVPDVRTSAVWSTAGMVVQGLVRLAYSILVGRVFGPDVLGHTTALLTLAVTLSLLWPVPAGNAASRFLALAVSRGEDDAAIRRVIVGSFWISAIVLGLASVPLALWLVGDPVVAVSGAALVVAYSAYIFARGVQLGYHRAKRVALVDGVTSFVAFAALVGVLVAGVPAVVLVPITIGYAAFAAANWPRGRTPGSAASGELRAEALRFAAWNIVGNLATNGLLQMSMLAAQVLQPGTDAGIFAAAFSLATPASMLGQAVSQVVIPMFAGAGSGAVLRERSSSRFLLAFTAATAVAFGLVAALAPFVLPLLYGPGYEESVVILEYLIIGVFLFTVGLIPAALLLATGRSRAVATVSTIGLVLGFGILVALAPSLGMYAGVVGFIAGSAVTLVLLVVVGLVERREAPIEPASGSQP